MLTLMPFLHSLWAPDDRSGSGWHLREMDPGPLLRSESSGSLAGQLLTDDDLFQGQGLAFPQPPPRLKDRDRILSRPSLPSLKTAHMLGYGGRRPSVPSLDNKPHSSASSTASAANTERFLLAHQQSAEVNYSWDFLSPAISDGTSAETDYSVMSLAPSLGSEAETHGPHTPITPNSTGSGWRPRELNLLRRRDGPFAGEPSTPSYQSSHSWQMPASAGSDRAATLVGLGIAGTSAPVTGTVADKSWPPKARQNSILTTIQGSNPGGPGSSGPRDLLLSQSGGPPSSKRFQGPKARDDLGPPPDLVKDGSSSRSPTPLMRSPLPVLPSTPAFTSLPPSNVDSAPSDKGVSLTAEKFLARLASRPEMKASVLAETSILTPAPHGDWLRDDREYGEEPPLSAVSTTTFDHFRNEQFSPVSSTHGSHASIAESSYSSGPSALGPKAPGFSTTRRNRASSSAKRKAPPAPLILTPSPKSSLSGSLPASASTSATHTLDTNAESQIHFPGLHVPGTPARPSSPLRHSDSSPLPQSPLRSPFPAGGLQAKGGLRRPSEEEVLEDPPKTAFFDFETDDEDFGAENEVLASDSPIKSQPIKRDSASGDADASHARVLRAAAGADASVSTGKERTDLSSLNRDSLPNKADESSMTSEVSHAAFEFEASRSSSMDDIADSTLLSTMDHSLVEPAEKVLEPSNTAESSFFKDSVAASESAAHQEKRASTPKGSHHAPSLVARETSDSPKELEVPSNAPEMSSSAVPKFRTSIFLADARMSESGTVAHHTATMIDPKDPGDPLTRSPQDRDHSHTADTGSSEQPDSRSRSGTLLNDDKPPPPIRKDSLVPAPPEFAIKRTTLDTPSNRSANQGHDSLSFPQPPARQAPSSPGPPGLSSRWSSGSESGSESVASSKSAKRKSSRSKKVGSIGSRKNSLAVSRDAAQANLAGSGSLASPSEKASANGSKSRSSLSGASVASNQQSSGGNRKTFFSTLTGRRKKSLPASQGNTPSSSSPATPMGPPEMVFSGPMGEFPFPPVPSVPLNKPLPNSIEAARDVALMKAIPQAPRSAPQKTLTTQQLLEQARENIWPESLADITSTSRRENVLNAFTPTLQLAKEGNYPRISQDGHKANGDRQLLEQRLTQKHFSPVSGRASPSVSNQARGPRLATAVPPPPKNLRHARKTSSISSDRLPSRLPADLFKPRTEGTASHEGLSNRSSASQRVSGPTTSGHDPLRAELTPRASPRTHFPDLPANDRLVASTPIPQKEWAIEEAEEASTTVFETRDNALAKVGARLLEVSTANRDSSSSTCSGPNSVLNKTKSALVESTEEATEEAEKLETKRRLPRRRVKARKARLLQQIEPEWPHRTSLTDVGRAWFAERGDEALTILEAEGIPGSMALSGGQQRYRSNQGHRTGSSQPDPSDSDTDDYGSSDGGGYGGEGHGEGSGAAGGGDDPNGSDDDDDDDDEGDDGDDSDYDRYGGDPRDDEEDEDSEDVSTEEESEDDYGPAEGEGETSMASKRSLRRDNDANPDPDTDSSDDRPLGERINDPQRLQKALRDEERRRHLAKAASALESGAPRGTSQRTLRKMAAKSSRSRALQGMNRVEAETTGSENPLDISDLSRRLQRVQTSRDKKVPRALHPINTTIPDSGPSPHTSSTDSHFSNTKEAGLSREHSVDQSHSDRGFGLRARPSDHALRARARAMSQAHAQQQSQAQNATLPQLPSNPAATTAVAAVTAAQQAMAAAQANPTPANRAQAKAMAAAASAAMAVAQRPMRSATLQGHGAPVLASGTMAGANLARARTEIKHHRPQERQNTATFPASGPLPQPSPVPDVSSPQLPAEGESQQGAHPVGMRPRARSRAHIPAINTAVAPPMPELMKIGSPSLNPGSNHASPHSPNVASFASFQPQSHQSSANHAADPGRTQVVGIAPETAVPAAISTSDPRHDSPGANSTTSLPPTGPAAGAGGLNVTARVPYKVFIFNKQRFGVAEIPLSARARDLVLEVIETQGIYQDEAQSGFVLFDCSSDFGIERPIREYEMVHEVADTRSNVESDYFLLKRTELSPYLSIRSVPMSSPALAGWVYVQDRKKKWSKRWLELRDHALFHAKSEKLKDEVLICQMSAFDVYLVDTNRIKTPKAHAFALRSQDKITMFEKPDQDYIHYFSLSDPAAHRDWVRAIMNARTYVLKQERAVLFRPPASAIREEGTSSSGVGGGGAGGGSGALSRRSTTRRVGGRGVAASGAAAVGPADSSGANGPGQGEAAPPPLPAAPLISREAFSGPFEKGSLLADMAIKNAADAMRVQNPSEYAALEARRREDALERQRKMKADGQPLIDLMRK